MLLVIILMVLAQISMPNQTLIWVIRRQITPMASVFVGQKKFMKSCKTWSWGQNGVGDGIWLDSISASRMSERSRLAGLLMADRF